MELKAAMESFLRLESAVQRYETSQSTKLVTAKKLVVVVVVVVGRPKWKSSLGGEPQEARGDGRVECK